MSAAATASVEPQREGGVGWGMLTAVAGQHDLALAAVEREQELPLDHDTVVERHGSVNGRLHAWGEVDQAGHATVGHMDGGLFWFEEEEGSATKVPSCYHIHTNAAAGESWGSVEMGIIHLVVFGIGDVSFVVHVDGVALGAVDDVGDGLSLHHQPVVVAIVVGNEHALAVLVVRADVPARGAKVLGGEFGDGSFCGRHDGWIEGVEI